MPTSCISHSWSIAVELQFYLISPLITWASHSAAAMAPRRHGMLGLAALSVVPVIIRTGILLGQGQVEGFFT